MSINNRRQTPADCQQREPPEPAQPAPEAIMATSCESARGNHGHHQLTRFVLQVHLAFSTLLSSQETGAHLARTFVPVSGQLLNLTILQGPGQILVPESCRCDVLLVKRHRRQLYSVERDRLARQ